MSKTHFYETTEQRRHRISLRTGEQSRAHAQRMCGVLRGPYTTIKDKVTCVRCLRLIDDEEKGVTNYD